MSTGRGEIDFEALIGHTVDMVTVLDESGTIQYTSPATTDVVGYEPAEMVGENAFADIHPADRDEAMATFNDILETEEQAITAEVEFRYQHQDGTWVWLEARASPQTTPGMAGYVISSRDISERKRYEQELQTEHQRMDRFLGTLSHDLRNPLSVLEGRLELLQAEQENEHLDAMERALDRATQLVDDMVTAARDGDADPQLDAVLLPDIAPSCWEISKTESAELNLETENTIIADPTQLRHLLENLFRNAVDHGGPTVTVTVGDLEDGFYVADDGAGITGDAEGSLFDYGFSTDREGTGFGLAIVEEVATNHGWTVEVAESSTGGARFEIRGVELP